MEAEVQASDGGQPTATTAISSPVVGGRNEINLRWRVSRTSWPLARRYISLSLPSPSLVSLSLPSHLPSLSNQPITSKLPSSVTILSVTLNWLRIISTSPKQVMALALQV
jgi:hypothetical protein